MFNIIPQPVSVLTNSDKKGFTLHAGTTISPYPFSEDFVVFVRKHFNKKVRIHEDTGEEKSIILTLDGTIENDEGYTLKCADRRVFINAKTETGLFYGLQTLKQMLLQTDGKIPYTEITDYPRFARRGFTLTFGRYFYSVEDIKKIIDLMAIHKLNTLNWCDSYNHYTQEDTEKLVAYCQERKIEFIKDCENTNFSLFNLDFPYGWNTLKKVCNTGSALTDETQEIYMQMNTEYVPNMKRFEYLSFPRMGVIAENAWAEKGYPSFTTFLHKSSDYYKTLDAYNVRYAPVKKACPSFIYKQASSVKYKCKVLGHEGQNGLRKIIKAKQQNVNF